MANTVYESMMQRLATELQAKREDQRYRDQMDRQDRDLFLRQQSDDFDRRLKLIELESKTRGAMGMEKPMSTRNPDLNTAIGPAYMAGQYEKQQGDQTELLKKLGLIQHQQEFDTTMDQHRSDSADRLQMAKDRGEQAAAAMQMRGELSRQGLDARRQHDEMMALLMKNRQDETDQNRQDQRIQKLGNDLKPVAEAKNDADILQEAITHDDISGQGPIDQLMYKVGLGSADDIKVRQAAKRLLVNYLHTVSGTAVTDSEANRAAEALGLNSWVPERFRQGVHALIHNMQTAGKGLEAKARSGDLDVYHSRGGVLTQDLGDNSPAPQGKSPKQEADEVESIYGTP